MKARFFALAALVLGLASCQQEFDGAATVGGEVDFQLNVAAPDFGTRANDGDNQYGYDSAFGAIDYLSDTEDADRVDWTEVNLRYTLEVYDAGALKAAPVKDRQVKIVDKYESVAFDLRLVPNRNYQFVVFADFVPEEFTDETITDDVQGNAGLHHVIGSTLQDIKIKNDAINNECTDAYFVSQDILIKNSAAQDLVLRRPFGKVRVIATDLHELNLNVEPKSVKVTYESLHANAFNAVEGTIDGKYTTNVYTNVYNDIKKTDMDRHIYTGFNNDEYKVENANGEVRNTHMTLFTDYILANADQESIHFTMEVFDANGQTIKETIFNTDIPVQRNYLTTIIGNVLTTATEINVTIDDNFKGEYVKNMVLVNTAKELQEALDAYEDGQIILFENNLAGNFTIVQKEDVNVVIDGNGYEFDGIFTVNGDARSAGEETLTFQNINFRTQGSDFTFISAPSKINNRYNYSHNVTVKNCTFEANHTVGCASFTGAYNIVMENCKANNVHSIAQFQSIDNTVRVENIEVTNSKSGLAFGNTAYPTLKDAKIEAAEYGVRADGDASRGNLVIEDATITAKFPVIVRRTTTEGYTINLADATLNAPGYHVVFTKGSDSAEVFEAPEVKFTVKGAENFNVFPGDKMFAYNQASLQYFLNNIVAGENVITLAANINGDVKVAQKADTKVTIKGNDYEYAGVIVVDGKSSAYATTGLTISNVNFKADTISADACVRLGDGTNATRYTSNVTVEGCTFNVPGAVCVKSYTGGDKNLAIKNCTAAANTHSLLQVKNIEGITIEDVNVKSARGASFGKSSNCTVKNSIFNVESYGLRADGSVATSLNIENTTIDAEKPVIVRNNTADYQVHFTGANELNTTGYQVVFTTGDDEAAFVAPTHDITVTGADDFVVFPRDAENNGIVYNATELTAALNNSEISTIYLQAGEYGTIVAKSNKTIIGTPKAKVNAVVLNGSDNVTLKNIVFDAATAITCYDGKGNTKQYANIMNDNNGGSNTPAKGALNIVIEGCTFAGTFAKGGASIAFTDQSRSGGFSGNITIKGCTFETEGGYYDIYGHYCGNGQNGYGDFVIENNTFNSSRTQGLPVYLGRYASSTPVVVKDNAFNTVDSLANAVYVQDHNNYGVSVNAENNTFAN